MKKVNRMKEVSYSCACKSESCTYSVDNMVIHFEFDEKTREEIKSNQGIVGNLFNGRVRSIYRANYKRNYEVTYNGITINIGLFSTYPDSVLFEKGCYIRFNPNKVLQDAVCFSDICSLLSMSIRCEVYSMDIAIDIPIHMDQILAKKDKRIMHLYLSSFSNYTIYYGRERNNIGTAKVYNKNKESKLDYPLTRIEITVGNPSSKGWFNEVINTLPNIWLYKPQKDVALSKVKLCGTDKVLIDLLRTHPYKMDYLQMLGRRKREKLEPFVMGNMEAFQYDYNAIKRVADYVIDVVFNGVEIVEEVDLEEVECKMKFA